MPVCASRSRGCLGLCGGDRLNEKRFARSVPRRVRRLRPCTAAVLVDEENVKRLRNAVKVCLLVIPGFSLGAVRGSSSVMAGHVEPFDSRLMALKYQSWQMMRTSTNTVANAMNGLENLDHCSNVYARMPATKRISAQSSIANGMLNIIAAPKSPHVCCSQVLK